jgi:hypothetical protein
LDQFVQRTLGIGAYVRYVDDFVLLHTDPAVLELARARIVEFLRVELRLGAHAAKPLRPASHGVDFCGFVVRPGYPGLFTTPSAASSPSLRLASFVLAARCGAPRVRLAALLRARPRFASETELSRRSLVNNPGYLLRRQRVVAAWQTRCVDAQAALAPILVPAGRAVWLAGVGRLTGPLAAFPILGDALDALRQAWASGRGATAHGASASLHRRAERSLPFVMRYIVRRGRKYKLRIGDPLASRGLRLWPDWPAQRASLLVQTQGAICIVQMGRLFELIAWRDAKRLRIRWRGRGRGRGCGVGRHDLPARILACLRRGYPVAIALEGRDAAGAVKNRTIRWWIEPLERTAAWWQAMTSRALLTSGRARLPEPGTWRRRG